jgi:hypothetical protein
MVHMLDLLVGLVGLVVGVVVLLLVVLVQRVKDLLVVMEPQVVMKGRAVVVQEVLEKML